MGAVCPSCGVAVVPGYVRCPKCHAALPHRAHNVSLGGTAVIGPRSARAPILVIAAVAVVVVATIAWSLVRGSTRPAAPHPATTAPAPPAIESSAAPPPPQARPTVLTGAQVAARLQHELHRQSLRATVEAIDDRVDVQSPSCGEPGLKHLIDVESAAFRAAGLTTVRCLEESGAVVFEHQL
ncbi:MAG TPA: hypothetical protein VLX92_23705 [Kofleriaceae bacterium]|nr:hypothetical protein [Kofleriaceae bacterium]